tara:strand:+ start:216 stop:419 length:204 start_codon:yes stop_codon:yes gene_type:complete
MNKIKSEKHIHRNFWTDRCNDYNLSNVIPFYNIHLNSIADEINEVAAAAHCSPHNSNEKSWKKRKVI